MGTSQLDSAHPRLSGGAMYRFYLLALAACLVGNLGMRVGERVGWLQHGTLVATAIVTASPLVVAAIMFWRMLKRELDEMLQRILLEGLAFALIVYVPLAGIYVNLQTAGAWGLHVDSADIMLTPALLAAIGIAIAWRRYR